MKHNSLLITCEHAGNDVPPGYENLFANVHDITNSHRGWDPGAWPLAESLGKYFDVESIPFFSTRLLIEPNRSIEHPELFSEFSNTLSCEQKDGLINSLYTPYREEVMAAIGLLKKPVLHLSIHTFTPILNGVKRSVDMGLLFDPGRSNENLFCEKWKDQLVQIFPDWKIEFNKPYKGVDDGFTTYLRTQFSDEQYLGIELEWNQKWATKMDAQNFYPGIIKSLVF